MQTYAPDEDMTMMYENVVRDFAARTRKNLRVIEHLEADGQEVYEVTQLVNSMLKWAMALRR